MHLNDALIEIAEALQLEPALLIDYATEDSCGGYPEAFHTGSVWEVEGRYLYALVRALRPDSVLEIGTHVGGSATHILAAMDKNAHGTLTSIDLYESSGSMIPDSLRGRWNFIATDGIQWTEKNTEPFDIVFEDGPHSVEFTQAILSNVKARVYLAHDACHAAVGDAVREGFVNALGECHLASIEPSDCGIGWLVK